MHVKQTRKESRRAKDFIWRNDNKNSEIQTGAKIDKGRKWKKVNIVDKSLLNHFPRLLKCRDYFRLNFPLKNVLEFLCTSSVSTISETHLQDLFPFKSVSQARSQWMAWKNAASVSSSSSNLLSWGLSLSPGGTSVFYLQYWPTGHLLSQQTVIKFWVWYIFFFF